MRKASWPPKPLWKDDVLPSSLCLMKAEEEGGVTVLDVRQAVLSTYVNHFTTTATLWRRHYSLWSDVETEAVGG